MDSPIYTGELNGTPLGDLRLAASDFGLVAVEWADAQPEFDSYLAARSPSGKWSRNDDGTG